MNPSPSLFYVQCPTCEARLRFSNEKLVGQIVPCPKCRSMVLVQLFSETEKSNSASEKDPPSTQPSFLETTEGDLLSKDLPTAITSAPPVVKQEIQPPEPPPIPPFIPSAESEEDFLIEYPKLSLDQPLSASALLGRILSLGGIVFVVLTGLLLTLRGCLPTTISPSSDSLQISKDIYPSSVEEALTEVDSERLERSPGKEYDLPMTEDSAMHAPDEEVSSTQEESPWEDQEKQLSEELMQSDLGRQLLGEQEITFQEKIPSPEKKASQENSSVSSEKKRISIDSSDSDEELDFLEPPKIESIRPQDRLEFQRKTRPSLFTEESEAARSEPDENLHEALEDLPDLHQKKEEDAFAEEDDYEIVVPPPSSQEKRSPLSIVSETGRREYLPESMSQKLDIPLKNFQMEEKPITSVLKMVTQISGIPLHADWKRLKGLGAEPSRTLSLRMQDTTVREVLEQALEECSLGCMPNRQTLHIVGREVTKILQETPEKEAKRERYTLNLEDLATVHSLQSHTAQSGLQEILRLIRMFVHPATWDEYGGPGKITSSQDASKVSLLHYPFMADEVQRFCNQLRFARKMPLQKLSEISDLKRIHDGTQMRKGDATPRWIQSEKARKRLIACDFSDGAPLREALEKIAEAGKIQLLLEEAAIARISVKDLVMDAEIPNYDGKKIDLPTNLLDLKVAKSFENLSLEEVLTDVIRPFPLFCYPISTDVFFLTTPQAAARKTMVEFYPIGDILSKKEAAGIFLESIRKKNAPNSWKNQGGMGEIVYDAPSRSLIVLQSPVVLRQIENFLEKYRQRSQTHGGAK